MGPIAGGSRRTDTWLMVQLAIRCHPFVPVEADERPVRTRARGAQTQQEFLALTTRTSNDQ